MKNLIVLICTLFSFSQLIAQSAKKYVLFEHFTQASCGPCADQNPAFQNNILDKNKGTIHHLAVHTSWPGTDPMYSYNTADNAARSTYYGVSGVPTMQMLGNTWSGQPGAVTQGMIDSEVSNGSPISIRVTEEDSAGKRNVTVIIHTVGTAPTGTLKLRVALVEADVTYTSAPGTNGEKFFPNVFRKMMPSTAGAAYTAAAQGDSVVFRYSYAPDSAVSIVSNLYTIAFVQNESTKEILNSGSSLDPAWAIINNSPSYAQATEAATSNFVAKVKNSGVTSGNFQLILKSTQPSDWTSSYTVGGNTYTDTVLLQIPGGTTMDVDINAVIGTKSGIGSYKLSMSSIDDPSFAGSVLAYYAVSDKLTDLVVDNDGGKTFEAYYMDGLNSAGAMNYAGVDLGTLNGLAKNNLTTNIRNIYWNAAWSFPYLTDANVGFLASFLDAGKHLLIAGQDLGWDTWDLTNGGNGTAVTQAFYTEYLSAQFQDDGSTSNNSLRAVTSDDLYGSISTSTIIDVFSGNMYPDEIKPIGAAMPIFTYGSNAAKVAGIRHHNTTKNYKVVYLGVGLEMLYTATTRAEIMKTTFDWFNADTLITDIPNQIGLEVFGVYPNPSSGQSYVVISNPVVTDFVVTLTDAVGRVVEMNRFDKTKHVNYLMDFSKFNNGLYLLNVRTSKGTATHKISLFR